MRYVRTSVFAAAALSAILIGAQAVTGAQAAAAAPARSSGHGPDSGTIRLIETATVENLITVAAGGPVGNQFVFSSTLTDLAGQAAGHDGGSCVTTNPDGEVLCTIAVSLSAGEITFSGLATGTDNVFAITGGTGAYTGARGVARAVDVAPGQADITIELQSGLPD